jgi:zinc transport system substrate-binding protein
MKKLFIFLALILIIGVGIHFALKNKPVSVQSNKLQVAASFYPYYFFASEIGGDKVNVVNITPAGAEPHDYEPTSGDIVQIEQSKLLIINGSVEAWGDKIKLDLKNKNTKVLETGNNLFTQKVTDEEGKTGIDPHIWLSPALAKKQVKAILAELLKIDPANRGYYYANANKLLAELDSLDNDYKAGLKSCQKKNIVTSHAAFGYLASDYGLTQVPIAGLSPDAEPSLKQLANIANFVRQNNIKYIFFESLVSPKLSETIASETGAKTLVLNPLEGLTPEEISQDTNYLTIMQNNLQNLRTALECK